VLEQRGGVSPGDKPGEEEEVIVPGEKKSKTEREVGEKSCKKGLGMGD